MGRSVSQRASRSADRADRYALYEKAVQAPEQEIELIEQIFAEAGRPMPLRLREDFCGTGLLCAAWARSHPERTAIGLDLDPVPLAYGAEHHLPPLGRAAARVELLRRDVLSPAPAEVDLTVAFNFSYCVFKSRAVMRDYFTGVRDGLRKGGAFILDVYGGPDAQSECDEKTSHRSFTYVWQQGPYDAVTACAMRYITFHFPDGSKLDRAFTYDWRIWTLPELAEILVEAGFTAPLVYWEGVAPGGGGNGEFTRVQHADNEQAWIAYLVAWK